MPTPVTDSTAHVFTVIFQIASAREPDTYARRVYDDEALGDALLGGPDAAGIFELDFDREAVSFPTAVLSAVRDVQRVLAEAVVLRVAPDDLVTVAAIAERVGRSHESVRLLARGRRGPGGFPPPAGQLDAKTQVWRWFEVARWFQEHIAGVPGGEHAAFLAALNDILDLRRVAGDLPGDPGVTDQLAALLPAPLMTRAA